MIERVPRELTAAAVLGGTPSAAHSEALLRAIEFKGATLDEPLDAIVIGIPPTTPFLPARRPEPGLGGLPRARARAAALAERASRCSPAARRSCSTTSQRRFPAPMQTPYRALFADPRTARDRDALREAEQAALADERAIAEYRAGRSIHPLEPFLTLERLRRRR